MSFPYRYIYALLLLASVPYAMAAEHVTTKFDTRPLSASPKAQVVEGYGKLPLSFEPNQGQTDPQAKFLSRGDGYSLFLAPSEAVLSLRGKNCHPVRTTSTKGRTDKSCAAVSNSVLRMTLLGTDHDAKLQGEAELPGKSSYFIGNDPSAWHTNIPNYRKVQYRDIYPGIDLVYYGNQRQLEHDFIVAPGADPKTIRLEFRGARQLSIDHAGNLKLFTVNGVVQLKKPVVYQETTGARQQITGRYIKKGNEIGFSVGKYDRKKSLVIDPVLVYSTLFGGSQENQPMGIAADSEGNAYVTGFTESADFPLVNPIYYNPPVDNLIGFISKISSDGSSLIYSTFIGDGGETQPLYFSAIAVDALQNVYLTGSTSSTTLPVVNALQPTLAGQSNAFVMKLNAAGSALDYSTYLGGSGVDFGRGIAVDPTGAAYVTGIVTSKNFPIAHPFSRAGGVFISKLNQAGSALEYSTRIGGKSTDVNREAAFGITVNSQGEATIAGYTVSPDFPLKNPLFSTLDPAVVYNYTDSSTVFVTQFNAAGSELIFSTLLGGGIGYGIATNGSNDIFLTGRANSPRRFSTAQSLFPTSALPNTFITRLKADGSAAVYSTYLGSTAGGRGAGIGVDTAGNAYVTGETSGGLPLKDPIQPTRGGDPAETYSDAFVTKIDATGSNLLYSTYFGGSDYDGALALAIDGKGDVFITGETYSLDFPTKNALRATTIPGVDTDGFVVKIADNTEQFTITNSVDRSQVSPGGDLHYTITVTNIGSTAATGLLTITSVRDRIRTCTASNGDNCKFVPYGGRASVQFSPLAKGESRTALIYATAAANAGDYNLIPLTANISSAPPQNETHSASVTTTVRENADIAIASSLADSTNGQLHYVHTVTNLGPNNAHAVLLLDPLPANTSFVNASTTLGKCSFHPTIGANGSVRCTLDNPDAASAIQVNVVLQATSAACPAVSNTTSVTSQSIDAVSGNDSSTVVTQLPVSLCKK